MSIPGVFKPHTLYIKDIRNNRIKNEASGLFVDGGVLYNYPIDAFDTLQYQTPFFTDEDKDALNPREILPVCVLNPFAVI